MKQIGLNSVFKIDILRQTLIFRITLFSLKSCATHSFLKERLVVSLPSYEDMVHDFGRKNATFENMVWERMSGDVGTLFNSSKVCMHFGHITT